jgi:hypothetical protein
VVLRERVRAGELTPAQIELAARLGHVDARALLPEAEDFPWSDRELVRSAIRDSAALLGTDTLPARVAADWAERVLPDFEAAFTHDARPREAIVAARAWAACPCLQHELAALDAANAAYAAASETSYAPGWCAGARASAHAAACATTESSNAQVATDAASAATASAVRAAERAADYVLGTDAPARKRMQVWQGLRLASYLLREIEP